MTLHPSFVHTGLTTPTAPPWYITGLTTPWGPWYTIALANFLVKESTPTSLMIADPESREELLSEVGAELKPALASPCSAVEGQALAAPHQGP